MWKPTSTYSYYQRPQTSDELYHHGILGQRWGKKNGPPYPLDAEDHSSAEKKAGYKKSIGGGSTSSVERNSKQQKEFVKYLKKRTSKYDRMKYDDEMIDEMKKNVSKETLDKFKKATEDLRIASDVEDEFYESEECYEASAKAYDDTYKWYEKNDPDYLNSIIKDNGGDKDTLDQYHDFRKICEGYEDERWTEARNKYIKKKGGTMLFDEAYDNFKKAQDDLVNDMVGKYHNISIKEKGTKYPVTVSTFIKAHGQDLIKDKG